MARIRLLSVTLVLFAAIVPCIRAQSMFGTLSGTVIDSAGAVVVGADVRVTNTNSGEIRKTVSNSDGYFVVSTLPVGTYEVDVTTHGFAAFRATGITLTGGESRTMTATLKIGTSNETVEVKATTTNLAPIDSGEKAYTISAEDLSELALVSRDATEIVGIMPGASMIANASENRAYSDNQTVGMNHSNPLNGLSVNGQDVDTTLDGGHFFDPGAGGTGGAPVTMNQDMISEVKILTSNFTADNPKGPVVVNAVTKAGGKDFHGDLRINLRNSSLNSYEAFEKANGIAKPNTSYYYPGFGLSGPVIFPHTNFNHNRDKLFFFESFEFYKQTQDFGLDRAYVATDAMKNGDFSSVPSTAPYALNATPTTPDWSTGVWGGPWVISQPSVAPSVSWNRLQNCAITGGVLNSSCIDPNMQALLKAYLPEPTTKDGAPDSTTGFNYVQDITAPMNMGQNMARVEWDLNENNKLTAVYNYQNQQMHWNAGLWTTSGSDNAVPPPTAVIGNDISQFVNVSFLHVFSPSMTSETKFIYTDMDYPEKPVNPEKVQRKNIPNFALTGIWNNPTAPIIAPWGGGYANLGSVGYAFHPDVVDYSHLPAAGEDLTKVWGTHDLKFGTYVELQLHSQDNWDYFNGAIQYADWSPMLTGNLYADTLTGAGSSGYLEAAQPPSAVAANVNTYAFYAQDSWKVNRRLVLQYGMRFDHYGKAYQPTYGIAVFNPSDYDPSASVDANTGVEWHSMNGKIPLSGQPSRVFFYEPRVGFAYDVFGKGATVLRGGYGMYRQGLAVQNNGITQPAQTALGSFTWSCGYNDPMCPAVEDVDTHTQSIPNWGHTGLGPGLKGLTVQDYRDDQQPLVTTYSLTIDQKLPWKMSAEASYVGNLSTNWQSQSDMNAVPNGTLLGNTSCTSAACVASHRPFPTYQAITATTTLGKSRYDAFQLSVQRRSPNTTLLLNYTFSKSLGDGLAGGGVTDGYKDHGESEFYGVLQNNRPNVFSAAYVVRLPQLAKAQALVRQTAGGWELSGVTQIQSGANLTSSNTGDPWSLTLTLPSDLGGSTGLLGSPDTQLQPLITCDPRKGNPSGVFLNASCFAAPPGNGVNGTTKMPYLPGPMFWKSDLTLMKNFKVTEKQSLQIRGAAFNFMNHDLLSFTSGDPNLQLIFSHQTSSTSSPLVMTNSTFGKAMWHYGQRIIELGAKYSF